MFQSEIQKGSPPCRLTTAACKSSLTAWMDDSLLALGGADNEHGILALGGADNEHWITDGLLEPQRCKQ